MMMRQSKDQGQPFGKPFAYTDAWDLQMHGEPKRRWWHRKPKPPLAWVTSEPGEDDFNGRVIAYTIPNSGECKVTPVEPFSLTPVHDEKTLTALIDQVEG